MPLTTIFTTPIDQIDKRNNENEDDKGFLKRDRHETEI